MNSLIQLDNYFGGLCNYQNLWIKKENGSCESLWLNELGKRKVYTFNIKYGNIKWYTSKFGCRLYIVSHDQIFT